MKTIKFAQTICAPCNVLNMMMADMGVEADESRLLDTPEDLKAAEDDFGVMSTPTIILFDDEGNEVERTVGIRPPAIQAIFAKANQ